MTFDLLTQTHAAPFVVLSPGCSGANRVAAALHGMGVSMGTGFLWTDHANPGAYEDQRLRDLDAAALGGNISCREWVFRLLDYCDDRGASGTQWGMSDPRLCDLAGWLRRALPHGRYIRVVRPVEEAIAECEAVYGVGAGPKVARSLILRREAMLDEHFSDAELVIGYRQALEPTLLFPRLLDFVKARSYRLVTN